MMMMKKELMLFLLLILLILCAGSVATGCSYRDNLALKASDYSSIEFHLWQHVSTIDEKHIELFVEVFNSMEIKRSQDDTLQSPEFTMNLARNNGGVDSIWIYGGAYEESCFVHFNGVQYRIISPDDIISELKQVIDMISEEANE